MRFDEPVTRYLSSPVHAVSASADLDEVRRRLEERDISSLAVLDERERLVGVITRTDLLRVGRVVARVACFPTVLELPSLLAHAAMTPDVVAVAPDATLGDAARLMLRMHVHRVFVVDEGRAVGVVSTRDVMRAVIDRRHGAPIAEYMSAPVLTLDTEVPLWRAVDRLTRSPVSGLVVTDGDAPVGLFTDREALEARDVDPGTPVAEVMRYALLCLPASTPLHRAAAAAVDTRARRVLAVEDRALRGILTGLDLARAAAG